MQDNIPDALITAFERQYDSSWNDPQLRNERLAMRYGWAAAMEAKPCLHQIQEPAPATAMDALREAEAALEVAMARILKADPSHSICVTSEAKALVAVRAALAATPTAAPVVLPEPDYSEFEQQLPIQPIGVMGGGEARKVLWNCTFMPEAGTSFYTEQQVRALLATGGQAQAVETDLHGAVMNLQASKDAIEPFDINRRLAYKMGHRDSRHAAAELIALHASQAQADARDAVEFWGVMAPCGEGVIFNNEADARWTLTGHGSGSDGFGVPTIGEAFRECYEDEELELVRVHIAAIAAAKGEQQ